MRMPTHSSSVYEINKETSVSSIYLNINTRTKTVLARLFAVNACAYSHSLRVTVISLKIGVYME